MSILWIIALVLIVLWALGFFGSNISPRFPKTGNWVHTLLVLAVILILLDVLGVI